MNELTRLTRDIAIGILRRRQAEVEYKLMLADADLRAVERMLKQKRAEARRRKP